MEINMPFLKIPYRDYPKEGLFKNLYRENITHALNLLKKDELIILKKYLEKILFGGSSNLIQQIGEHYLFRSIEYLEKLINNS